MGPGPHLVAGGSRSTKGEDRRNILLAPHSLRRPSAAAPSSQPGWEHATTCAWRAHNANSMLCACACVRTQTRPLMIISAQACARDLAVSVSVCCEVLVSFSAWTSFSATTLKNSHQDVSTATLQSSTGRHNKPHPTLQPQSPNTSALSQPEP